MSYLTNLPGASERLRIFEADLDRPGSFAAAIRGCVGVFHVAHPLDFEERESEEVKSERVVKGAIGILRACVDTGTVKRVVYCSSLATVACNEGAGRSEVVDESSWSDVEFVRRLGGVFGGAYIVTKTLVEKAVMEYGEEHGLDVVAVLPSWIHGPFICSYCPDSVGICMALIRGSVVSLRPHLHVLISYFCFFYTDCQENRGFIFVNCSSILLSPVDQSGVSIFRLRTIQVE